MAENIQAVLANIVRWGSGQHPKIFISYRRHGEGAGYGGRIADKLVEHFGAEQCFRDVNDIESGVDFVKTIREAVGACEVLIAVIGPDWMTQTDARGMRRLDDPRDFVRLEVSAALERDIRVIPVLVGGAAVPTEQELPEGLEALSRRQAHELTDTRWEYDVTKLLRAIESIGIKAGSSSRRVGEIALTWKAGAVISALVSVALVSVLFIRDWPRVEPQPDPGVKQSAVNEADIARTSQLQSELDRERRERQRAEEMADEERRKRREREEELERKRQENAAQRVATPASSPSRAASTERTPIDFEPKARQVDTFNGIYGRAQVSWQHEGLIYNAAVTTSGPRGTAVVSYMDPAAGTQLAAEQDLDLLRNAGGIFYVGSNPRIPGTTVPHPSYVRDIFRLDPLQDGSWTISEVGDSWDHFDRASTTSP